MPEPRISVIQPGARLHYAMPKAFAEAGLLAALYTDLHAEHRWLRAMDRALPERAKPRSLRRLFGRRLPDELPAARVRDRPAETLARAALAIAGIGRGPGRVTAGLLRDLESAGLGEGDVVYTVLVNEDVEAMQRLKARGVKIVHECFVSPDIGIFRMEEHRRFPELDPAPDTAAIAAGRRQDAMKYAVADLTLVPSTFVEAAVARLAPPEAQIRRVPYGFELSGFAGVSDPIAGRALAVGSVRPLKGHPDLAEATRILAGRGSALDVRVVGPAQASVVDHPLMRGPTYVGQVPRSEIAREYARADFFVLPTICDSFGIAIVEAMAAGLPVITTAHCGDIVRDGVDGFVVPIRDPRALADRMQQLVQDRALRARMSDAARVRAQEFSQQAYAGRLVDAIAQGVMQRPVTVSAAAGGRGMVGLETDGFEPARPDLQTGDAR